jgi:membrane associated rhomboid family serine protease
MRIAAPATTVAALFLLASGSDARKSTFGGLFVRKTPQLSSQQASCISSLLDLRGGASKSRSKTASLSSSRTATGKKKVGAAAAEKSKKSAMGETMQKYNRILPLTRIYITMVGVATLLGLVLGEEMTQSLLALDPMRVMYGWELWRPLTAASFIGPPSIGWLMSGYYLFEYGSTLERAYGTAQHLVFLISQVVVLSILSILVGQPFFAPSVITAMLHVLSRSMPHQKVKWLIFTVPYWSLPYGLMASDVLQAQSAMAALPHVLGIISGHFYHFHKFIWPKMGGVDWLAAPDFLSQRFDPDAKKDAAKESVSKALKARKRNKGRKLGS